MAPPSAATVAIVRIHAAPPTGRPRAARVIYVKEPFSRTIIGFPITIACSFYGQNRRVDPRLRPRSRRAGAFSRGVPRLVISVAAGDSRPSRDLDGHTAQITHARVRREHDNRLDSGMP